MRQFMLSFPDELLEEARIEGASKFKIFFRIVLPNMKVFCEALGIITFLHQWESLLWPMVVANSPDMQTLSVGLATFEGSDEDMMLNNPFTAASIAATPLVVVFLFFQKQIIKGISLTGMK